MVLKEVRYDEYEGSCETKLVAWKMEFLREKKLLCLNRTILISLEQARLDLSDDRCKAKVLVDSSIERVSFLSKCNITK